jgi:hypothetical protein
LEARNRVDASFITKQNQMGNPNRFEDYDGITDELDNYVGIMTELREVLESHTMQVKPFDELFDYKSYVYI